MKKPTTKPVKLPAKLPSVPDRDAGPTQYNEPDLPPTRDQVPQTRFRLGQTKADLRLQVEQLLLRKEAAPVETWRALGEDARTLLVELLDDPVLQAQQGVYHRLIAVLGQMAVKRAVTPLSGVLANPEQLAITRTYAANALGRIGEPGAVPALAEAAHAKDSMIRRQVAIALGRVAHESAAAHLLRLSKDPSIAVAEVAVRAAKQQRLITTDLTLRRPRSKKVATRKGKISPAADL
jgi:HEAT repeat protein